MSDAVMTPAKKAPVQEEPYQTSKITYEGYEYTFSFYKGFASEVTFTPPGALPIVVYQQTGVFNCHDTNGPLPVSTLSINGGPLGLDIEVEIEDGPLGPPTFRGPIEAIQLGLKRAGTRSAAAAPGHRRVKPCKGADQIARITVKERVKLDTGGVFAFQEDEGGTVIVKNTASTCPPDCR